MVLVEGIKIKIKMKGKPIRKKQIVKAWKTLSSKPLPKVKALQLSDEDFNYVIQHRHCFEDELCEIEEWGRVLSTSGTDACVFNAEETRQRRIRYTCRETPYNRLDEIILHELSHIARGDLANPLIPDFFGKQPQALNAGQIPKVQHKASHANVNINLQLLSALLRRTH